MKTCPNCNTSNEDVNKFCSKCGTRFEEQIEQNFQAAIPEAYTGNTQAVNPDVYSNNMQAVNPGLYTDNVLNMNPNPGLYANNVQVGNQNTDLNIRVLSSPMEILNHNVDVIGEAIGSKLSITYIVSFITGIILFIIELFLTKSNYERVYELINRLQMYGFDTVYGDVAKYASGIMLISIIIVLLFKIPSVLCAIGLIKLYKNRNQKPIPVGGFSLVKVLPIFKTVLLSLVTVILIIVTAEINDKIKELRNAAATLERMFGSQKYDISYLSEAEVILIAMIFCIVIIMFIIVVKILEVLVISNVKRCASTGHLKKQKKAGFIAVLLIIESSLAAIGVLFSFTSGITTANQYLSEFCIISAIICDLVLAIAILKYRKLLVVTE